MDAGLTIVVTSGGHGVLGVVSAGGWMDGGGGR